MTHWLECRRARTHTYCMRVNSWTFVINSHSGLMFTAYSLSKPQTCLFLLSQNNKRPLSKHFFFVFLTCLFFLHALRSLTNELNTEETWKWLDKPWLFEQWGENIVPYDYTHLYQASSKVWSASQLGLQLVRRLHMDFSSVWATSERWSLCQEASHTLLIFVLLKQGELKPPSAPQSLSLWQLGPGSSGHQNMFKVLHDHMFAHWGAEQGRAAFYDLHPGWAVNTPGSSHLGSCQVRTVVEHPRHATGAQAFEHCRHTEGGQFVGNWRNWDRFGMTRLPRTAERQQ